MATTNRYALHTLNGCTHPASGQGESETGTLISTDCFNQTNGNQGCIVQDPSTNSYGSAFATNGGGVFATLWDSQGIRIWFFERARIPTDLPTDNPSPEGWGTPTAFYPTSACDTSKFFGPQTLIFVSFTLRVVLNQWTQTMHSFVRIYRFAVILQERRMSSMKLVRVRISAPTLSKIRVITMTHTLN